MVLKPLIIMAAILASSEILAGESRTVPVAMTVAVLDVAKSHCRGRLSVDTAIEAQLVKEFRDYDVGGVQSAMSGPLNAFYEEFLDIATLNLVRFCREAPSIAAKGGYPGLLAAP
jgi:hypothetical protein